MLLKDKKIMKSLFLLLNGNNNIKPKTLIKKV